MSVKVKFPMPGSILEVLVNKGDKVKENKKEVGK